MYLVLEELGCISQTYFSTFENERKISFYINRTESLLNFSFQLFVAGTTAATIAVSTIAVAVAVPVILVAVAAVGVGLFLKR